MSCANSQAKKRLGPLLAAILMPALLVAGGCAQKDDKGDEAKERAIPAVVELAGGEAGQNEAGEIVGISPAKLQSLEEDSSIRLIDVRRDDEVAQGMIPGAEHITLSKLDPAKLDLSDGREVVFYCRSGNRSAKAARKLARYIDKPVRHLDGGIKAWKAQGLPVSKPKG